MKNLVIGPGAMGFFSYLGAITKLKRRGELDSLEEISGSSAGSLLSFLFCLTRGDTTKILEASLEVPVHTIVKPNLKTLMRDYGLVSSQKVRKVISETCMKLSGLEDITFKDLYELNPIKLHISSYCVDLMKTVYFSVDTAPTMSVIDAVCASIAIPFLFSSLKLSDGWRYIDGASIEDSPGAPFLGQTDVLVVKLGWNYSTEMKDFKTYAMNVIYSTMKLRYHYDFPTIDLVVSDEDIFNFGASNDGKLKMFLSGYDQM